MIIINITVNIYVGPIEPEIMTTIEDFQTKLECVLLCCKCVAGYLNVFALVSNHSVGQKWEQFEVENIFQATIFSATTVGSLQFD